LTNDILDKVNELRELCEKQGIPLILATAPNKNNSPILYAITTSGNKNFFHLLTNLTSEYLERTGQIKITLGTVTKIITDQLKPHEVPPELGGDSTSQTAFKF
jgi:hypothetical protein